MQPVAGASLVPRLAEGFPCNSAGQAHLLQQFSIAPVLAQAFHQRTRFQFGRAGVALLKRAFQPLECLVSFPAKGIDLGDLISTVVLMRGDEFFQGIVRILATAERMVSQ